MLGEQKASYDVNVLFFVPLLKNRVFKAMAGYLMHRKATVDTAKNIYWVVSIFLLSDTSKAVYMRHIYYEWHTRSVFSFLYYSQIF